MMKLTVGQPWIEGAGPDGMRAIIEPNDGGLALTLALTINKLTAGELKALREGRIRMAVLSSPPLAWIILDAGKVSFDAPYAAGITTHPGDIALGCAAIAKWTAETRGLANIIVIDRGKIAALRMFSLSRDWWSALAQAILAAPPVLDIAAYHRAIERDAARMTTPQMLAKAAVVEVGGVL